VIQSFRGPFAEVIFNGTCPNGFPADVFRRALAKLQILHAATNLATLATRGNNLEALHGDRAGQHSIRINQQWRVCFEWNNGSPQRVEVVDYH
jgi:proteic killer suppression protein